MSLLQYILVQGGPAAGSKTSSLGIIPTLYRFLGNANDRTDGAADVGTDLRQAALSVLLELARSEGTWEDVKRQAPGLPEVLLRLRDRHAALPAEDREAEQEEDELAEALLQQLETAPAPGVCGSGEGTSGGGSREADHVPIDLTEPNLRDAAKGTGGIVVTQPPPPPVEGGVDDWRKGGGAMIACPRMDKI